MPKVTKVLPNIQTHKEFGEALENAVKHGVKILYLPCVVKEDCLEIKFMEKMQLTIFL